MSITIPTSGSLKLLGAFAVIAAGVLSASIAGPPAQAVESKSKAYYGMTKINVSNLERSQEYYTKMMGLKVAQVQKLGGGLTQVFMTQSGDPFEQAFVLVHRADQPVTHGNNLLLVFIFDDIKKHIKALQDAKYEVTSINDKVDLPNFYVPGVSVGMTKDPDGYRIEMVQYRK